MTSPPELRQPLPLTELEPHELTQLSEARPRRLIAARGEVARTETIALGSSHAYRCLLRDGSGSLTLLFIGRRKVAGLEEGVWCRTAGRVAVHDNELVLWNPRYDIEPFPPGDPAPGNDTPPL